MTNVIDNQLNLFHQFDTELSNPVALVLKAAEGLTVSVFNELLQLTALNKRQLAAFIKTTPKTIDN